MGTANAFKSGKKEIIRYHLDQSYGELNTRLDMDYLLNKYHIFPNEAVYVIDCKNAQLEPLSKNFNKIIGIGCSCSNDLSLLYDHVHESNFSALHHWVMTNLKSVFDHNIGIQVEKDVFKCMYKTVDGRVLLKCTTGLVYDNAGRMRYTLGKLIDLTGLISFQHFGYQYYGPSQEKLYEAYQYGRDEASILTRREKEIIYLLRENLTSQEIAAKLCISIHTVDTHRRNIIEKMETKSASEAYKKCKNLGWI